MSSIFFMSKNTKSDTISETVSLKSLQNDSN